MIFKASTTSFQNFPKGCRLLFLAEFIVLCLCYLGGAILGGNGEPLQFTTTHSIVVVVGMMVVNALFMQLSLMSLGLYNPKFREHFRSLIRRTLLSAVVAQSLFGMSCLLVFNLNIVIRLLLATGALGAFSVITIRYVVLKFNLLNFRKINVLVIGAGERASIIERRMRRAVDRQNFKLAGFVAVEGDSLEKGIKKEKLVTLDLNDIQAYVLENSIHEVVIACDDRRSRLPVEELFACKLGGVNVIDILDFIERETGQLAVNLMYPSWIIYSNGFRPSRVLRNHLDWLFNTLLAGGVFLVTWPVIVITVLAIKLEDGWKSTVLYAQNRVGLGGKVFKIYKFRSMLENAEENGPVWAQKGDSRTTRVGSFIRKYRIDELPQLYNVLVGEMGFVGPRPERPEMIKDFVDQIPYYDQRHNVKPGLTGWAQLKYPYGSSFEDTFEKLKFDLYYVKHRSFLLDLSILLMTAEVVLFGKGR